MIFTLFQGIQSNKIFINTPLDGLVQSALLTVTFKWYHLKILYINLFTFLVLDLDFTFLEMNPFTLVDGKPYPLDMRGELDDTAAFKNFKK